ncbi:MAG: hypothetical protein JW940_26405 [Polyangiaceae bacterium]|nr:hypothetical protein [Polyangiaceae bacterium]
MREICGEARFDGRPAIGFYLLSEEVKKHVKVLQSGQGADEVLAGHQQLALLELRPRAHQL